MSNEPMAMPTEEEIYHAKREELINKFSSIEAFRRLYYTNSLFTAAFDAILQGQSPYIIIEKMVDANIDLFNKFKSLIEQWPSHNPPNI